VVKQRSRSHRASAAALAPRIFGTLVVIGCSGNAKVGRPPKPAPYAPSALPTRTPAPPTLGPVRVADDRHYLEKRADRDEARLNEMLGGALWRAQRACRDRPADQRRSCVDAELDASSLKVLEQAEDAFGRLEAMNRACGKLPGPEMDACAARFVPAEVPEEDRWVVEAERGREMLGCERPRPEVSAACRALAAFGAGGSLPSPAPRWIGAAVAASYRGHLHHELVMGALETTGDGMRLCLAFVTPDDARERAELEAAIRELLLGRTPSANRVFEFTRSYSFDAEDCKPVRAAATGAWVSLDGKWQVTRSETAIAVRARHWGPGYVLMLAELRAQAP
jgi:hypothetical protein